MTAIERTAYPRFSSKAQYRKSMLETSYQLSNEEVQFIKKIARNVRAQLNLAIQLKVVQNIGYFIDPEEVPGVIQKYLRSQLLIKGPLKAGYAHRSFKSSHRNSVRDFLGLKKWNNKASTPTSISSQRFALNTALQSAATLNHPADIINIVIEVMVSQKYELPNFNTLDRLVRHAKYVVNSKIFNVIKNNLENKGMLPLFDKLLITEDDYNRSGFNALKNIPKSISHKKFRDLLKHHSWLQSFGEMESIFEGVKKNKLHQFAAQAQSLDVTDLEEMSAPARYSLISALLFQAQKESTDALATSCCRIIFKIQKQAKDVLEALRNEHAETAKKVAVFLMNITACIEEQQKNPEDLAKNLLDHYQKEGGTAKVSQDCEKVSAYNSKNYLPLMLDFFHKKRALLIGLLKILKIHSATQDHSLIQAIQIMLEQANKRTRLIKLENALDLSFASEEWKNLVYQKDQNKTHIDRYYFEACVFTYLASDLRSGDIYIDGAETYADYRKDLLPWEECLLMLDDFCAHAKLPNNAKDFVKTLKQRLSEKALQVDLSYPDSTSLVIDEQAC